MFFLAKSSLTLWFQSICWTAEETISHQIHLSACQKGGGGTKKAAPAAAKPISCVSHAKTSVQPFSRSESRCSCPTLTPDASFLQRPAGRLATNEDRFYECVRSTLSQPGSYAKCSSKLQHCLLRPPSVTSPLTPSGCLCCFKRDESLYMA